MIQPLGLQHSTCPSPQRGILLHILQHPERNGEGYRSEGEGEDGADDDDDDGVVGVRVAAGDGNLADDIHERRGHVVAAKGVLDALVALVAHADGLGVREEQGLAHDGGAAGGLFGHGAGASGLLVSRDGRRFSLCRHASGGEAGRM